MSCNPDDYKHHKDKDIEDISDISIDVKELSIYKTLIEHILERNPQNDKEFDQSIHYFLRLNKGNKLITQIDKRKCVLMHAYNLLVEQGEIKHNIKLRELFIKKRGKSLSGVLVITILTSPYPDGQKFSCEWNCYFCPNEPDQPRSYLHDEPAVLRANRNAFDPIKQIIDRIRTLEVNGHPIDKIELLILGGTWTSYPETYKENFICDSFYACNTYFDIEKREKLSLYEEKLINETSQVKIIGITIELRPDCINANELRKFRNYGITRVQMGAQHINDDILSKINRGCTYKHLVRAIKLLKDSCYKLDLHIMPNLPGSSPELDSKMFYELIHNSDLQVDQWKIYPCEIVPWTVIKTWFEYSIYIPYPEKELMDILIEYVPQIPEWVRVNRILRDIPKQYISNFTNGNLRNDLDEELKKLNKSCKEIRSREVKNKSDLNKIAEIVVEIYNGSDGIEYFISFETPDRKTIFGFLRLRLSKNAGGYDDKQCHINSSGKKKSKFDTEQEEPEIVFPELIGCALIRELHVYGKIQVVDKDKDKDTTQQHIGFGKQMMAKAEDIAIDNGYKKIAVISGVGVRNYYRKLGYELDESYGEFMIKQLHKKKNNKIIMISIIILLIGILIYYFNIF